MWVNKKIVGWQRRDGNTLRFEVFTALLLGGGLNSYVTECRVIG